MELGTALFATLLLAVGLLVIMRVKDALREDPPADLCRRDRQRSAYEERRMRLRRDRVWQRIDAMYDEFNEREVAGGLSGANGPAPQPAQGRDPERVAPVEARPATEQPVAARRSRRAEDPPPAL